MDKNKKSFISHILSGESNGTYSGFWLEMRGAGDLAVGGCRGFFEYGESGIGLVLIKGRMRIYGSGLTCDSYTNGAVLVKGKIRAIELLEEAEDEAVL